MLITLKAARVNAGLTQLEAAKRLEISESALIGYEKGRGYPNVAVIKRMETLYGVPYDKLNFLPQNDG